MGARLGRYVLLKHLASGGMANVLLAKSDGIEGFERHVVIKRIRPEMARDHRFIKMFLDEARVAATLHHQNIVQVHDIGEADGEYFIAMEYVHGEDARKLLSNAARQRTHVPLRYAIAIVSAAAAALHAAHEQRGSDRQPLNIVHRDVSPSNIRIGYDGSIKLLDFGIATASSLQETHSGSLKGKLAYMSPEQCKGTHVDRRTDIYALGAVLYELATTSRMIRGANDYQVMEQVVQGRIAPPQSRRAELPSELTDIIMRALSRDRDDRYATADDFRIALEQFATSSGLTASSSAMAAYMQKQFGTVPEPWLALGDQSGVNLEDAPSAVYGTSSNWGSGVQSTDHGQRNTGSIPMRNSRLSASGLYTSGLHTSPLHTSPLHTSPVHAAGLHAAATTSSAPRPEAPSETQAKLVWRYQPEAEQQPQRRIPLWKLGLITAGPVLAALIWLVGGLLRSAEPVAAMPKVQSIDPIDQTTPWRPLPGATTPIPADAGAAKTVAAIPTDAATEPARKPRVATVVASRTVETKSRPDRASRVDAGHEISDDPVAAPPMPALPTVPAAAEPAPVAVPAVAAATPAVVAPRIIAPSALEANRISGNTTIIPDPVTRDAIGRTGVDKVISVYKMCLAASGAIDTVTQLKSSGYPAYDEKIRASIQRDWRYRPYIIDGKAQPVCISLRIAYSQK